MTEPDPSVPGAPELTRTARFAKFLRSAVAIKTKSATDVQKYLCVIWFSSLPGDLQEVRSPLITLDRQRPTRAGSK